MNRQSDYGYTVSPNEQRDHAFCLKQAELCEVYAKQYFADVALHNKFKRNADEWRRAAEYYK